MWQDQSMASPSVVQLLKLPAAERAELAMALWESLSPGEREAEFDLTPEQAVELDRRWQEHLKNPASAIPWDDVRRKILDRE
jgi:putative addiction module component (TIGR02574 family)